MRFTRVLTALLGSTLCVSSVAWAQTGLIMPPAPTGDAPIGDTAAPAAARTVPDPTGDVARPTHPSPGKTVKTPVENVFDSRVPTGSPESISGGWVDSEERGQKPVVVRPRYGSLYSHGAYHPQMIPAAQGTSNGYQPGGAPGRVGSPYYYSTPGQNGPLYQVHQMSGTPWGTDHSVYQYHFGPGHYRTQESGHYRFPYYSYRAPWYFPGHPIYNRFTNQPW